MTDKKDSFDKDGEEVWKKALQSNIMNIVKNNLETMKDSIRILSELRMTKYASLIEAGFTKEEALFICTNTKIME